MQTKQSIPGKRIILKETLKKRAYQVKKNEKLKKKSASIRVAAIRAKMSFD